MLRKSVVTGIVLLFLHSSIIPFASSNEVSSNNIIYVDDDNTMGPWDGTQQHPYQLIQDGIDNASDGDTVFVYNGTYFENVIVNKTINLIGEGRNSTIIDGSGHEDVIFVTADHVIISDFTIQNSGDYYHTSTDSDAGIDIRALYVKISSNNIINNRVGIFLFGACETIIKENIIQTAGRNGIELRGSGSTDYKTEMNTITGNNISYNGRHGIRNKYSYYNSIYNNSIYENKEHGISVSGSAHNDIIGNVVHNNVNGINHYASRDDLISNNTIFNNDYGIFLWSSSDVSIFNNSILSNRGDGIYIYGGKNVVQNNMISNNGWYGIRFELLNTNEILDNTIQNNTGGIRFYQALWCSVFNNTISDNVECGIFLEYGSNNNDIIGNTFERNEEYAVYLDVSEGNDILSNTILQHDMTAYFEDCDNSWWRNYWNRPRILPYLILGEIDSKLRIDIDWCPRLQPNNIGGGSLE